MCEDDNSRVVYSTHGSNTWNKKADRQVQNTCSMGIIIQHNKRIYIRWMKEWIWIWDVHVHISCTRLTVEWVDDGLFENVEVNGRICFCCGMSWIVWCSVQPNLCTYTLKTYVRVRGVWQCVWSNIWNVSTMYMVCIYTLNTYVYWRSCMYVYTLYIHTLYVRTYSSTTYKRTYVYVRINTFKDDRVML
jgi:hypothetical protein